MGRSRKDKRGTQRWGERAQFPGDPEHEDAVITMMCRNKPTFLFGSTEEHRAVGRWSPEPDLLQRLRGSESMEKP